MTRTHMIDDKIFHCFHVQSMTLSCEIRGRSASKSPFAHPTQHRPKSPSPSCFSHFAPRLISVTLLFCGVKRSCQTMLHTTTIYPRSVWAFRKIVAFTNPNNPPTAYGAQWTFVAIGSLHILHMLNEIHCSRQFSAPCQS